MIFVCCAGELLAQPRLSKAGWNRVFREDFSTNAFLTEMQSNSPTARFDWRQPADNAQDGNLLELARIKHIPQVGLNGGYAVLENKRLPAIIPHTYADGSVKDVFYSTGNLRTTFDEFKHHGFNTATCGSPLPDNNRPGGYLYGMMEVRCKLSNHRGCTSSAWLFGNNAGSEHDLVENLEAWSGDTTSMYSKFFSTVHYHNPNGNCSNYYKYMESLANDFHTWTLVWTPFEVTWFLDGIELKTHKGNPLTRVHNSLHVVNGAPNPANPPQCGLFWYQSDLVLTNCTYGLTPLLPNGLPDPTAYLLWNEYAAAGIVQLKDMLIDHIEIYKPAALTQANPTIAGLFELKKYGPAGPSGFQDFNQAYIDHIMPAYQNAPYRNTTNWIVDFVGFDVSEFSNNPPGNSIPGSINTTPDYAVASNMVPLADGASSSFVYWDATDLRKLYLAAPKPASNYVNPLLGVPHTKTRIANYSSNASFNSPELATGRYPSHCGIWPCSGQYTYDVVYFRKGNVLWHSYAAISGGVHGAWTEAVVASLPAANDVGPGDIYTKLRDGLEVVVYKNTAGRLVELARQPGVTNAFSKTVFSNANVTLHGTTAIVGLTAAVSNQWVVAPGERAYYFKSVSGSTHRIVKVFRVGTAWKYLIANISGTTGGVQLLRARPEWSNNGGHSIYFINNAKRLRTFDGSVTSFGTVTPVLEGSSSVEISDIEDFIVGNAHDLPNPARPNIYFKIWNTSQLWMLEWNPTLGGTGRYERKQINFLQGKCSVPLRLMNEGGLDVPAFWLPTQNLYDPSDGNKVRKLRYKTTGPIDYLPCNATYNSEPVTYNPRTQVTPSLEASPDAQDENNK